MQALACASSAYELPRGERVGGRYVVEVALGKGAGGVVYRAYDEVERRGVCLKMLRAGLAEAGDPERRFEREWELARRLDHPSICRPLDHGRHDGVPWLVLELIKGRTLAEWLEAGPLPIDLARAVAVQVAAALGAAHDAGIVHRDVKPGNIMIEPSGRVVLLDFGIALGAGQERLTKPGFLLGSAHYVAPEVWQGKEITPRSDVWSYGVILYACLTGRRPFTAPVPVKLVQQILSASPPRPRLFNKSAPPDLERVVSACLQVDPERRPSSGSELLALVEGRRLTPRLREVSRTVIAPRDVTMLPAPISFPGLPPVASEEADPFARAKTELVFRRPRSPPAGQTKTLVLLAPRLLALAPGLPIAPMVCAAGALLVAALAVVASGPSATVADVMVPARTAAAQVEAAVPMGAVEPLTPTPDIVAGEASGAVAAPEPERAVERKTKLERAKRQKRIRRERERVAPRAAPAVVVDRQQVEAELIRFNQAYDGLVSDEARAAFAEQALLIKRAIGAGDLDTAHRTLRRALAAHSKEAP